MYTAWKLIPVIFQRKKKPDLFWVTAIAPFMVVVIGGIFTFLVKGDEHGIPIVRPSCQIFPDIHPDRHVFLCLVTVARVPETRLSLLVTGR